MTEAYEICRQSGNIFLTWDFVITDGTNEVRASACDTHEPLLHYGYHEVPRRGENVPHRQAAPGTRRRGLLRVQQPLVGPERPVEPHRVVQAGPARPPVLPGPPVPDHDRVEQRQVRGERHEAVVQQRVVRKLPGHPQPYVVLRTAER